MKVFVVSETLTLPHPGSIAVFSTVRKAAAFMSELARDGRPAELIQLEVNDKVQKSHD